MHRDPNLRKRNALAITGTLLALLSLTGIFYSQSLRPDTVTCEDGTLVVFAGACRSATLLLLVPLALGMILLGLSFLYRPKSSCHIGHGTVATTLLSILVAWTFLPLLAGVYLRWIEDPAAPYLLTYNEVDFSVVRLLGVLGLGGFLSLAPFLGLYIARSRPRRCCRQKSCFEPCFCDEGSEGGEGGADAFATAPAPLPETETQLPPMAPPPMQSWVPEPGPPAPVDAPAFTAGPAAAPPPVVAPAMPTPVASAPAPWTPPPAPAAPAEPPARKPSVKAKAAPAAKKATRRVTRKK